MGRHKKFENRFEVIVETAATLFIQNGFENTTMDDIAKACNLGKATLYAEFNSKEDLMGAVILRYAQQAQAEMRAKADQAQGSYLEVLKEVLLDRVLGIYDRANKHFHSVEIMMAARKGQKDRSKITAHREEEFRIMANLLEKAASGGEIAPHDNYFELAKLLRKALAGLYPPNIFDIDRQTFHHDAEAILQIFLAGLTVRR